jgi:hypothetical protein
VVNFSSGEQKETEARLLKIVKNFSNRIKALQIKAIPVVRRKHFRIGIGIAKACPTRIEKANARLYYKLNL